MESEGVRQSDEIRGHKRQNCTRAGNPAMLHITKVVTGENDKTTDLYPIENTEVTFADLLPGGFIFADRSYDL